MCTARPTALQVHRSRRHGRAACGVLAAAVVAVAASAPSEAAAVTCDGAELLCLGLLDASEVDASGPVMVSGDFAADGFQPYDQGGLEWEFGPDVNLSRGRVEVTVTGLAPVDADELAGGKVSIFDACGIAPDEIHGVGLQKMAPDYHEGHVFRFGMDDDNLADNWDAVIITSADFIECPGYDIQGWQPGEAHSIVAEWGPEGMRLRIDGGYDCSRPGNGDAFWPASKRFTLSARCTHYSNQQAVARFRDFKLYALGTGTEPPACGDGHCDPDETCTSCPAECGSCGEGGGGAAGGGAAPGGASPAGGGGGAAGGSGASGAFGPGPGTGGAPAAAGGAATATQQGSSCGCRLVGSTAEQPSALRPWLLALAGLCGGVVRRSRGSASKARGGAIGPTVTRWTAGSRSSKSSRVGSAASLA